MFKKSEEFNSAVGAQLRAELSAAEISISEAAKRIGIARSTLNFYVKGERAIPVGVAYEVSLLVRTPLNVIVNRAQERFETNLKENVQPLPHNNVYEIDDLDTLPPEIEAEIRAQGIAAKYGEPESEQ